MYFIQSRRIIKIFLLFILISSPLFYVLISQSKIKLKSSIQINTTQLYLPDIDNHFPYPDTNHSATQIFFIETTHPEGGYLELNPRKACSIESAARFHPDREIFVIFTGPTMIQSDARSPRMDKILTDNFKNVHYRSLDVLKFSKNTPMEEFFLSDTLSKSSHPKTHLADILRLIVLWKYGGLYFDLDIVVLKSFDDLGEDYVCKASDNFIMSGTMQFSGSGIGHKVVEMMLNEVKNNYNPGKWGANGPELLTKIMMQLCDTQNTDFMTTDRCQGMKVLESEAFLPIKNNKWYVENNKRTADNAMKHVDGAYTAHVYNHLTKNVVIKRDSQSLYLKLAKMYCPIVYESFDTFF